MTKPADVVVIAGSPSSVSRSAYVLRAIGERLEARGLAVRTFAVHDLPAEDVLRGRSDSPEIAALLAAIRGARALVLGTPVYKAVYSGALKAVVDLIPPDGLEGKVTLGVATARADAHGATVDRAFTELFRFFRGAHALPTFFLLDAEIASKDGSYQIDPQAVARFDEVAAQLSGALDALAKPDDARGRSQL